MRVISNYWKFSGEHNLGELPNSLASARLLQIFLCEYQDAGSGVVGRSETNK